MATCRVLEPISRIWLERAVPPRAQPGDSSRDQDENPAKLREGRW